MNSLQKIIAILFFIFTFYYCFSQKTDSLEVPINSLNFEVVGNKKIIFHQANKIISKDFNTNKLLEYSNKKNGLIAYSDFSNPMKLLVYFENINSIIYLDTYLNELTSPLRLETLNILSVGGINSTSDGCFWIFDSNTMQLKKISKNLTVESESIDFQLHFGLKIAQSNIQIIENNIILHSGNELYIFDENAQFLKKLSIRNIPKWWILDKNKIIFQHEDGYLLVENVLSGVQEKILVNIKENITLIKEKGKNIYILTKNKMYIIQY
jgi:hypothetical protein